MHRPLASSRVAVINSNEDLVDMVSTLLQEEGYVAIPGHVRQFRLEEQHLSQFIAEQDPQVILWDIAPPYDLNWQYFQEISHLPIMQGRSFIVTTTHIKHLREVAGEGQEAIEILDKPYDLEQVLRAVQEAFA